MRPTSRTSPLVPRAMGMRSASQASRRTVAGLSSRPSSVIDVADPDGGPVDLALEHVEAGGDRDAGAGAVAVRRQVGGQGVVGDLDEGVPQAGAVVARVGGLPAVGSRGSSGGLRLGQRQQGGLEDRGVLDGAAAAEPHAAGAVLDDGEEPAVVRGPVGPVQVLLGLALGLLRVGDLDQVLGRLGQVGGVQPGRPRRAGPPHPAPGPRRRGGACRPRPRSPRPAPGRPGRPASPHGSRSARSPAPTPAARSGARRRGGCRPGG